jgi:hypothetical protein
MQFQDLKLAENEVQQWRTKGQNQNKNQRRATPTPSNIFFLLVLRKPKICFKLISQPTYIKFSSFMHFQYKINLCRLFKKTCKIYQKMLCSEIQPLPRHLQSDSTNSPPLPLVSQYNYGNIYCKQLHETNELQNRVSTN